MSVMTLQPTVTQQAYMHCMHAPSREQQRTFTTSKGLTTSAEMTEAPPAAMLRSLSVRPLLLCICLAAAAEAAALGALPGAEALRLTWKELEYPDDPQD